MSLRVRAFLLFLACVALLNVVRTSATVSYCLNCPSDGCDRYDSYSKKCTSIGGTFLISTTTTPNQLCCNSVPTPFFYKWTQASDLSCTDLKSTKLLKLCAGLGGTQSCNATSGVAKLSCNGTSFTTSVSPSRSLAISPSSSLALSPSKSLAISPSSSLAMSLSKSLAISPSSSLPMSLSKSLASSPSSSLPMSLSKSLASSPSASLAMSVSKAASPVVSPTTTASKSTSACINCRATGCKRYDGFSRKCSSIGGTFVLSTSTTPNQLCCNTVTVPFTYHWTVGTDSTCSNIPNTKLVKLCAALSGTQTCNSTSGVDKLTCTRTA